jgi:hypothetical protein
MCKPCKLTIFTVVAHGVLFWFDVTELPVDLVVGHVAIELVGGRPGDLQLIGSLTVNLQ